METPETYDEAKARRRQRTIVLVVAGLALCCVCLVLAIAVFSWSAIRGGQTQEISPDQLPQTAVPVDPSFTADTPEPGFGLDEAPTGGLGNDILRNDTWETIAFAAIGQGCDRPVGADSTIEVLQEPDANGKWVEQWTVACASGDSYAYEVEYILDDSGTTFNIKAIP